MFQKSTHRATSPDQFKNGLNYVALVLSFAPIIIIFLAPIDRVSCIYLVILACLCFFAGSENERINEKGLYRYLLFFPVQFLPWEDVQQVSHTFWNAKTAYVISSNGCKRFEKHTLLEVYLLRYPFRSCMISGPNAKNARTLILKYFGTIDFEEDAMTP